MSDLVEEWRAVPSFEGLYEVSDWGRVRSVSRIIVDALQRHRPLKSVLRKIHVRPDGYAQVNLSVGNVISVLYVHDLVLAAFVGPKPERQECRHKDGARGRNPLSNLEYGTCAENQNDRIRHGTDIRGEQVHGAVLTENDVRFIRSSRLNGPQLGEVFGVNRATINAVRRGETWCHVR